MRNPRRRQRKMMSDMNVVPYIDVMLVLLIIFMITAPLITQGVKVDLPRAPSEVLPPQEQEPLLVAVDAAGRFYIEFGDEPEAPVDLATLADRVAVLRTHNPDIPVLIRGDRNVPYGTVVELMAGLQGAGVDDVGLVTDPEP